MVEALVLMGRAIGWRTVLVDPDGGSAERHPMAESVISELDLKAAGVDERSLVVVATQGHHDEEAIEQALLAEPAYVGLVGSRPRAKSVFEYLESRGLSKETLARVKVPAGLDLGKVAHREIAVGVLAELVKLRAAGEFVKGGGRAQPPSEIAEAIDPVCGMTVDVGSARHAVDHDGPTYYFCAPGCARAFKKDPADFLGSGATS
jgi:xanthine dehydrogenase accessory factor